MSKQPYIPLYTGDYLKKTRRLTLECRGAWIDLLIFMWESEEKGTITARMEEFALMMGCSIKKADSIITDLKDKKICDYEVLDSGLIKITSRRMVRDAELSQVRKAAGAKGGNPKLVNQNSTKNKSYGYPFSDNDNDNDNTDKKEPGKITVTDHYQTGEEAFKEIQSDEIMVERLVRAVKSSGYRCDEITLMKATKHFLSAEEAKPDFTRRPRDEIKKHLVNWVISKAKTLNQYG